MSSEIYYDRAFIRVGDRFIPVVNHGSSNCFDFDAHGREVPEKHWSVLNYTFHGRQLFTEEEIRQIAAVYEAANSDNRDGIRKSRNRSFGVGEFGRWIMNGMKTAHTVEEYRACGNTVVVVEYTEPIWKKHVVYTTEKLLDKLNDLDGNPISVSFWDDRTVTHPPTRRKNDLLKHNDLTEYYVLRAAQGFFVKRSRRRIWFARKIPPTAASVRKFGTEKAAQRYLEKNDLVYSYAADTRAALGVPHALYNCIASFQLALQLEPQARLHSFAKQLDHEIRESLTPERRLFRMAEQMGWVYQVFRQKAALKIKKRVFQMGEYISGFPADFWVSYIGSPLLPHSPELEAYLTDFQTWVLPDGASLAMEVTSLHGVLTCCIENKVDKPGYLEALRDVMEQEGIRVLEAVHIS